MTPALTARLTRYANAGTGADPLICAQNIPTSIAVGTPKAADSTAALVVHVGWLGSPDQVIVVRVHLGDLKLTDVRC